MKKNMMNNEIIDFFGNEYYVNFLSLVRDKYCSLGKVGGSVTVVPKDNKEALELSLLLSMNLKENVGAKVSLKYFQGCLDDSKFEGLRLENLLEILYPNIQTKREKFLIRNKDRNKKIEVLLYKYKNSKIYSWLECIVFGNSDISKKVVRNLDNIGLCYCLDALNNLPLYDNRVEVLTVFSSKVTKDPHFFDFGSSNNGLFISLIASYFDLPIPKSHQDKVDILDKCGIVIDDVSNFVLTYGFIGNSGLDYFKENNMPIILNLNNISSFDSIIPLNEKVLIVENPSFLNFISFDSIDFSIIVTSGNANMAFYRLLDRLKDCSLYYQGDFDPEGLLIADKLVRRYSNLRLIGYSCDNYLKIMSNRKISDKRLKMLDGIGCKDLFEIRDLLLCKGYAAYQEENYDFLLRFMSEV